MEVLRHWRLGAVAIAGTVAMSACSGLNSGVVPNGAPGVGQPAAAAPQTVGDAKHRKHGEARIIVRVPRKKRHRGRHPQYVSPSTKSMTVAVAGSGTLTYDLTPSSTGCATGKSGYLTCTETAFLPTGSQTLTITLYDRPDAGGSQLATASTTVKIKAAKATNIPITLGGIAATAAAQISGTAAASVPVGTPTSLPVTVNAYDADGNLIVAPGNFTSPITLTDSDASGVTSFTAPSAKSPQRLRTAQPLVRKGGKAKPADSTTTVDGPGSSVTLYYNGGFFSSATITPSINGNAQTGSDIATLSATVLITEYSTKTSNSYPYGIAAGANNAMWFTESCVAKIGQITTSGTMTEYRTKTSNSKPYSIAAGPDGALWFTELSANNIGRSTTTGTITEYTIPTDSSGPQAITAGPNSALWFTETDANNIAQVTTDGHFTEYPIPTSDSRADSIVTGPDGALWFTENCGNNIGRVTTDGAFTEYPLPTAFSRPDSIASGPDGALWFTELCTNTIGRITTTGTITEYTMPTTKALWLASIATGSDGALWFLEDFGNKVGRITTTGSITEYTIPTGGSGPSTIAPGPGGTLWFTEQCVSKIGTL